MSVEVDGEKVVCVFPMPCDDDIEKEQMEENLEDSNDPEFNISSTPKKGE